MPFNFEKRAKVVKDVKCYQKRPVVPDGGWGWVVCFAAACTNFTVTGLATSSGIFLIGLRGTFDDPVWKLALVGALLDGLSMLAGVSLGMSFFTCQIITGLYFDKKRALAIGINNCGGGMGTMVHATENDINIRHKGNEESDEQYSPPRGLIERLPSDQSTQRPEDTRNSIVPVKDSQENEKTVTEDLAFAEEHRESMAEMRQKILNTLEVVRHTRLGVSLRLVLTIDVAGLEESTKAFSILSVFSGIGYFAAPPTFGYKLTVCYTVDADDGGDVLEAVTVWHHYDGNSEY
ncbi:Hypothetical predicted protein [Octopus vulgaris]|uniref:Uncharacterized protein n=1 Tax=Octopus vulgaris TaxID=6645 RepID=A0AA36BN77_OCTVU|nr:Hypothetical predicted protein [Octopus vulgaris]